MRLFRTIIMISISLMVTCFLGNSIIRNNTDWVDTNGQPIYAHKGGISFFNGIYYWYGSDYRFTPSGKYDKQLNALNPGINVYSSEDLVNWEFRRIALTYPTSGWGSEGTHHRAHVVYNEKTDQYIMWFYHYTNLFKNRMASVAVADNPLGPFDILGRRETGAHLAGDLNTIVGDSGKTGSTKDLNIFKDSDGAAYLVYDDGQNNICVDKLTDDYLNSTKETAIALNNEPSHKAPSMIKYKGKYIVAASGGKEWSASETYYAVASSPLGPYGEKKCMSKENTWQSQITDLVYIAPANNLMVMCDQWWIPDSSHINGSRYLWLPVQFDSETEIAQIQYMEKWNPFEENIE